MTIQLVYGATLSLQLPNGPSMETTWHFSCSMFFQLGDKNSVTLQLVLGYSLLFSSFISASCSVGYTQNPHKKNSRFFTILSLLVVLVTFSWNPLWNLMENLVDFSCSFSHGRLCDRGPRRPSGIFKNKRSFSLKVSSSLF